MQACHVPTISYFPTSHVVTIHPPDGRLHRMKACHVRTFLRLHVHTESYIPTSYAVAIHPPDDRLYRTKVCHLQTIGYLARISHKVPTAAAQRTMSTAFRSIGLLDILSSMPAVASIARLVSTALCTASLRNPVRKAG